QKGVPGAACGRVWQETRNRRFRRRRASAETNRLHRWRPIAPRASSVAHGDSRAAILLKTITRSWAILLAVSAGGAAWAQDTPPESPTQNDDTTATTPAKPAGPSATKLERVEIETRRDDTDIRRLSTAAKIVIGREEIEQYGDLTLADVLKRLPSVT